MKMLTSRWFLILLALLIYAGTTSLLILKDVVKAKEPPPPPPEKVPKVWSFKTQAVDDLITELHNERDNVAEERKSLETLRTRLASERAEVERVRDDVKTLRDALDQRMLQIEETESKNLKSLSITYAAMKPSAAVAIFREMDENMAAKILALMKPDKISPILEEMSRAHEKPGEEVMARRAVRLSDKLRLLQTPKKEAS
jgi:flagellar motility protein MotE (MotC chaperone)